LKRYVRLSERGEPKLVGDERVENNEKPDREEFDITGVEGIAPR